MVREAARAAPVVARGGERLEVVAECRDHAAVAAAIHARRAGREPEAEAAAATETVEPRTRAVGAMAERDVVAANPGSRFPESETGRAACAHAGREGPGYRVRRRPPYGCALLM